MTTKASGTVQTSPAYGADRTPLRQRMRYDFSDYGFTIDGNLSSTFEIVPIRADDQEAFMFFFPREDIANGVYSLLNLHIYLKRTGSIEDFAHSLGPSVATIPLSATRAFGLPAVGYSRVITMRALFEGAPQIIDFIGGHPDMTVRDSHVYFMHRHNHCYTGIMHRPGDEARYDALRELLFAGVRFA